MKYHRKDVESIILALIFLGVLILSLLLEGCTSGTEPRVGLCELEIVLDSTTVPVDTIQCRGVPLDSLD